MEEFIKMNFKAPALPLPTVTYSQDQQNQLINALRLYFNRLDLYNREISVILNSLGWPTATALDAFGRLRVSQPYTIFDSQNRYGLDDQFNTATVTGGSTTYLGNESTVRLDVTTASGAEVVRQSYRVMPYQPGKGLLLLATFVMNAAKTGLRQRVGYFNSGNGVFLQQNDSTLSFVLRTSTSGSPSDARTVAQADWNGDKLDGTGASGIILDVTKAQILWMDFEWLGVGSVRCGFIIDGEYIVCHTFNNANDIDKVYMTTAILPVRYEITNTAATASASSMKQICSSVVSEGGYQQTVAPQWARMTAATTVGTAFEPLVSIRLNANSLGAVVLPSAYSALPTGTADYEIAIIKNAVLSGDAWNTTTFNNVDYDISATSLTGGTIIKVDYATATNQGSSVLNADTAYNFDTQLGVTVGGTSDIYTLAARVLSGSDDIIGALSFYDLTD